MQLLEKESTAKRSALCEGAESREGQRQNLPLHPDPRQGSDHVHTRPSVSLIITQQAISGLTHNRTAAFGHFILLPTLQPKVIKHGSGQTKTK